MKTIKLWSLVAAMSLSCTCALAGSVGSLTTFQSGTPAVAAEVNGNFTAVKTAVDDNDARIADNALAIEGKQNEVTGACPPESSIAAINGDGTVECEIDDVGLSDAGVSSVFATLSTVIPAGDTSIKVLEQIDIVAPANGEVVVTMLGRVITSSGDKLVFLAPSDDTTALGSAYSAGTSGGGALTHTLYMPYTAVGVFPVTAGTHTFYALAQGTSPCCNSGDATVQSTGMTAIFVPNSY